MKVILYTTHCPKCNVLTTKLKAKGVDYEEITDVDVMRDKGFMSAATNDIYTVMDDTDTILDYLENYKADIGHVFKF